MAKKQTVSGKNYCLFYILVGMATLTIIAWAVLVFGIIPLRLHCNACANFYNLGDYSQAIPECEATIRRDLLALCPDAVTLLTDARNQHKEQLYQQGLAEMSLGNWVAAEQVFRQLVEMDPRYRDVQAQRQVVAERMKEAGMPTPVVGAVAAPLTPIVASSPTSSAPVDPTATNTLIPTPLSTPDTLLVWDDFETGLNPAWKMSGENYSLTNGKLIVLKGFIESTTIGDSSWQNYRLMFHGLDIDQGATLRISVRTQDKDNHMYLSCYLPKANEENVKCSWHRMINGKSEAIPGATFQWSHARKRTPLLEVEMEGDIYRSYVDKDRVLFFIDQTYDKGGFVVQGKSEQVNKPLLLSKFEAFSIP